MKQKAILMIIPNLDFGGAQRVFHNLSIELSKKYRVVECVFNFDPGHAFISGNEVVSLDVKGGSTLISKVFYFFIRCRKLRALKKRINACVCISHLEGADYVNVLSRAQENVVCCLHGSKLHDKNISGFVGWIRKVMLIPWLYKRADALVAVSQGIVLEMSQTFKIPKQKITWIPNFFYPSDILLSTREEIPDALSKIFETGPVFITMGRLTLQKNQREFIEMAARFKQTVKSRWVVIGDGELLQDLVILGRSLNLKVFSFAENHTAELTDFDIYFLGYFRNPYPLLARADWFVLTSLWEGFPMVIGEAMACGVPVISSDCHTGPREFLANSGPGDYDLKQCAALEYGILIPVGSGNSKMDQWIGPLISLTADEPTKIRYRQKGFERVAQLTAEHIIRKWYQVIE